MGKAELKTSKLPRGLLLTSKGYIIDKVECGNRIYKRLGKITEAEAIVQFAVMFAAQCKGENEKINALNVTVDNVLVYYYNNHLVNIKSGKNSRFHIPAISRILGNKKVLSLRKNDIEQFIKMRSAEKNNQNQPVSARTVQACLQILSMAINHAVDNEVLPRNPVSRFCRVSVPRRKKIVLDHGQEFGPEWIRLYKNLPDNWRLFFLICYETGMRPTEVAQLETEWIQQIGESYLITVPANKEKTGFSDRRIPISKILEKRLIKNLPATGKLFKSWDYFKAFRQAAKSADLPSEITAYSLRRTRATIWDEIDSSAARVALGHAPLDPHEESYVVITNQRLFRLARIDLTKQFRLIKIA